MNHALFILLLLCGSLTIWAQTPQVVVKGTVYNIADTTVVSQVYVGSKLTYDGAISDEYGQFTLTVSVDDTLFFASVEFNDKFIPVGSVYNTADLQVYLSPTIVSLDEVTISGFSKEQFRRDFLELDLASKDNGINLNIPEDFDYANVPSDEPPSVRGPGSAGSGIGFGMLTKAQRQIKEFNEYKARLDIDKQHRITIRRKYNPALVQLLVPLTDEQLEGFMKFCDLKDEFILQSTEYEVGTAIKECYLAFLQVKP